MICLTTEHMMIILSISDQSSWCWSRCRWFFSEANEHLPLPVTDLWLNFPLCYISQCFHVGRGRIDPWAFLTFLSSLVSCQWLGCLVASSDPQVPCMTSLPQVPWMTLWLFKRICMFGMSTSVFSWVRNTGNVNIEHYILNKFKLNVKTNSSLWNVIIIVYTSQSNCLGYFIKWTLAIFSPSAFLFWKDNSMASPFILSHSQSESKLNTIANLPLVDGRDYVLERYF